MRPIKLSSKTLVHISSGLYRSTANALKELISNSFDADASLVQVNTNYPSFDVLTCRDNGTGMTKEEFQRLMEGGIGNSKKRTASSPQKTAAGRPVIGRIGIGLLAIAQVCYEFKVVSHHRASRTAFEAEVNLRPYRRGEVAAEETVSDEEYEIGKYECKALPYDAKDDGVLISTKDLLPSYTKRYASDVSRETFTKVPLKFVRFMAELRSKSSIRELGNYWRLFWELCLSCPVPYAEDGPLRADIIIASSAHDSKDETQAAAIEAGKAADSIRKRLVSYNFTATLDSTPIRKPIVSPAKETENAELRAFTVEFDGPVEGARLKYRGYIYLQTKMVKPAELRGLLIRVRNVAIGDYDLTCLNYEKVQGFRRDWLSGEIYVQHGLEDALNVDRHSFNEVHPHYLHLQGDVHRVLTEQVFPAALRASAESGRRRAKAAKRGEDSSFMNAVRAVLGVSYSIARPATKVTEGIPVSVNHSKKVVTICEYAGWPKNRIARNVAERLVIAYMLARKHVKDADDIDQAVFTILSDVGAQ